MVLIYGPLSSDLGVMHGKDTSFMCKSLWTKRQMVHINSPHKVSGLPNLIHGTDKTINADRRNTLATLLITWSRVRHCTRAREGMGALQAVGQTVVII